MKKHIALLILSILFTTHTALAHSGRTNSSGCHNNRSTGGYHCHNSGSSYKKPKSYQPKKTYTSPPKQTLPTTPTPPVTPPRPTCTNNEVYSIALKKCRCLNGYTRKNNRCTLEIDIPASLTKKAPPKKTTIKKLSDISNHKNQKAIQYLYDQKIIQGYKDGTFQPERTLNRAELLKILVSSTGTTPDHNQYNNCFPDVQDQWFAPSICYAKEKNWVKGYKDGTFKPEKKVNRIEAITMLINSQGYQTPKTITTPVFDDVDITQWYAPFLQTAKDNQLLEETSGNFNIKGPMTRSAIAESIYRSMISKTQ